jgi:ribosomal protein S18 acetylase RimI-like enzyme
VHGRGAREVRTEVRLADNHLLHFLVSVGFMLAGRLVLDRSCADGAIDAESSEPSPEDAQADEQAEGKQNPTNEACRVRSLMADDLPHVIGLDRRVTGRDRSGYYKRKAAESLQEAGIRLSLVAELDSLPVGFIMARVDYGEFGETEPEAVMDTLAVNPDFAGRGVATAMLKQLFDNLAGLRLERLRTEVEWDNLDLLGFLKQLQFQPSQRLSFRLPL